ncbi:hypothetical protein PGB90_009843 [Kerria lacca]
MNKRKKNIVTMDVEDSTDSDCELVIDETISMTNEEEKHIFSKKTIDVADVEDNWAKDFKNIFHPMSISSSDMKNELFHEETNTCNICNESFRYNVGLIYHLEMEHVEVKIKNKIEKSKKSVEKKHLKRKTFSVCGSVNNQKIKKVPNNTLVSQHALKINGALTKKSCEVCKKSFSDQNKLSKHTESCLKIGLKFNCVYCKSKFGWESKYKKHLFKTHKLNAAVICKQCSSVFADMTALAIHNRKCGKSPVTNE